MGGKSLAGGSSIGGRSSGAGPTGGSAGSQLQEGPSLGNSARTPLSHKAMPKSPARSTRQVAFEHLLKSVTPSSTVAPTAYSLSSASLMTMFESAEGMCA